MTDWRGAGGRTAVAAEAATDVAHGGDGGGAEDTDAADGDEGEATDVADGDGTGATNGGRCERRASGDGERSGTDRSHSN